MSSENPWPDERTTWPGAELVIFDCGGSAQRRDRAAYVGGVGHHQRMSQEKVVPPTYPQRLLEQLALMETDYVAVLEASQIQYVDPNNDGDFIFIVGAAGWGWAPSGPELEAQRMDLLGRLRDWEPRFRLLFPHPTPEVETKLKDSFEHLERWLVREGTWNDWFVPQPV